MCKQGEYRIIKVKISADLSYSGKTYMKWVYIDMCIADIVKAFQEGGIDMRASCCGHGKGDGEIILQDGRILVIKN